MIDHMAAAAQFVCHAPVAVAWHLVLDGPNQLGEPGVSQIFVHCRRPVVERAARKIDHLAPPSNGAGFGPVTIDKFSLSLTRRRRGVFFDKVELHGELADLAFEGRDLGLVFRDDRCLSLFGAQLSPVVLRQPELNQVGRQGVLLRRIAPADGTAANVLA